MFRQQGAVRALGTAVLAARPQLGAVLDAHGQETNRLHVVAGEVDDAREQFTAALERDRADRGLAAATRAAHEAVSGLAADGPVRLVNTTCWV